MPSPHDDLRIALHLFPESVVEGVDERHRLSGKLSRRDALWANDGPIGVDMRARIGSGREGRRVGLFRCPIDLCFDRRPHRSHLRRIATIPAPNSDITQPRGLRRQVPSSRRLILSNRFR
jgi:hypothetical protein